MKSTLGIRLLTALLLVAATCQSTGEESSSTSGRNRQSRELSERLQRAVTIEGIREHLEAFQSIAEANNGTRASGTSGYDESARYVAERLRDAGYDVSLQEFVFPGWRENSPPTLLLKPPRHRLTEGDEFVTMMFSPAGSAEGPVVPVDLDLDESAPTSGCESTDFAGFSGGIALMIRSNCFFRDQAANAEAAGALAALIMPTKAEAEEGVLRGTLTSEATGELPVMGISYSVGRRLLQAASAGRLLRLEVDASTEDRTSSNVLAEMPAPADSKVVMIGGHVDSVPFGPGINDNGSGTAAILEIAEELARLDPESDVRFAFWGAEEFGLLGSIHYVQNLTEEELRAIDAYLNFDMLGSSNFVRFVYDGRRAGATHSAGSVAIQRIFESHFEAEDLPTELVPLEDRSDHALFAASGIDVGGLFSGADEVKTAAEQRTFGGRAGEPHDPCYHLPCDTINKVNFEILDQMADAAAHALVTLAGKRN